MRACGIWAVCLLFLLAGCAPNAREPDSIALVRVLGVDGSGPVTVSAVCGGTDQRDPARGSAVGADFASARQALPWVGEEELALTHLSYIVVGEGAELREVLEGVLDDGELACTATLWQTEEAAALLVPCKDPASRLTLLEEQGVKAPTVSEALAALEEEGRVELPRLMEEEGILRLVEEALWVWEEEMR